MRRNNASRMSILRLHEGREPRREFRTQSPNGDGSQKHIPAVSNDPLRPAQSDCAYRSWTRARNWITLTVPVRLEALDRGESMAAWRRAAGPGGRVR